MAIPGGKPPSSAASRAAEHPAADRPAVGKAAAPLPTKSECNRPPHRPVPSGPPRGAGEGLRPLVP